jgi:hypothetical protein
MEQSNSQFGTELLPAFRKPVFMPQAARDTICEIIGHRMSSLDKFMPFILLIRHYGNILL